VCVATSNRSLASPPPHPHTTNTTNTTLPGTSYFRFVDVATGDHTPAFAHNHSLGCALLDEDSGTMYVYGTTADSSNGGGAVHVFWSTDNMQTWQSAEAVNFAARGEKVFNTSVGKGKLNGMVARPLPFALAQTRSGRGAGPRAPSARLDCGICTAPCHRSNATHLVTASISPLRSRCDATDCDVSHNMIGVHDGF
jgi:hypothetical protein